MKLIIRNQTCHLLAKKAVYWEEKKTLIIADLHIGKEAIFRTAGIPIPQQIMDDDLMEITQMVQKWQAEKCIIVGDLIHGKKGMTEGIKNKFSRWLKEIPAEIHLILGNHDHSLLKDFPATWPLPVHTEGLVEEPFYFSHYPMQHQEWFVWAGHIHPKVEIRNRYDRLVLRCFQIFSDFAILPAFGFFVGGAFVNKGKDSKIYAIADDMVIEV